MTYLEKCLGWDCWPLKSSNKAIKNKQRKKQKRGYHERLNSVLGDAECPVRVLREAYCYRKTDRPQGIICHCHFPISLQYPLACAKYAGLSLYFFVYISVTGKDSFESNTETWHHWGEFGLKHVRWTLLPATYWRSWKIILSVLRAQVETELFKLLYLWGYILCSNVDNLFFSNRGFLSPGSICHGLSIMSLLCSFHPTHWKQVWPWALEMMKS